MKKLALAMVVVGLTFFVAERDAHALGAEVGGDVGYGLKPFSSSYPANPFGFGLGAHAGVEISSWYLGASFRYYFGESYDSPAITLPSGATLPGAHTTLHTMQIGAELGYQVSIGPLTIRPYLWGGPIIYSGSTNDVANPSSTHIAFAPAAHAHVKLGSPFFLGADVRYNLIFGGDGLDFATQLSLMGSLGLAF